MDSLLFEIPETKSPRLLWMEKHGLRTYQFKAGETIAGSPWDGWAAIPRRPEPTVADSLILWSHGVEFPIGHGETEDAAIVAYAENAGVRLWNEEGAP